jgi:hypothetical protein
MTPFSRELVLSIRRHLLLHRVRPIVSPVEELQRLILAQEAGGL